MTAYLFLQPSWTSLTSCIITSPTAQVPGDWCVAEFSSESWLADALKGVVAEAIGTAGVDGTLITVGTSVSRPAPALIGLSAEAILLVAALEISRKQENIAGW